MYAFFYYLLANKPRKGYRNRYIPYYNKVQGARCKEQDGQAADEEDVLLFVVCPTEVLELQRQHWHFANKQYAEEQHEKEEEDCA